MLWLLFFLALNPGLQVSGKLLAPSPCPLVFKYFKDDCLPQDGAWKGLLTVELPPRRLTLVLKLEFMLQGNLPANYAGHVVLLDDEYNVGAKTLSGTKSVLMFKIYFPPVDPVPAVNRIIINHKVVCEKTDETKTPHKIIVLDSTLDLSTLTFLGNIFNLGPFLSQMTSINEGPIHGMPWKKLSRISRQILPVRSFDPLPRGCTSNSCQLEQVTTEEVCGRPIATYSPLIYFGTKAVRGHWPWTVAMYIQTELGTMKYLCAGTLIDRWHVVTAAHCMNFPGFGIVSPEAITVYLGLHDVFRIADINAQGREVEKIHVHPDYATSLDTESDLAVLTLMDPAVYTRFVRPVCLWQGPTSLDSLIGVQGTVVAWGRDEFGRTVTEAPYVANMPIVSNQVCRDSNVLLAKVVGDKTFCAGFANGTGPCSGDSGSGFVLVQGEGRNSRWYLRGVTIGVIYNHLKDVCDLHDYSFFADVAKFKDWIVKIVNLKRFDLSNNVPNILQ